MNTEPSGRPRFQGLLRRAGLGGGLHGISPSVLTGRLERMEGAGLVRRSVLPPPAAATVYELTEDGRGLRPAVFELIRWGGRFLFPPRRGERFDPEWMRLALEACARRTASPPRSFLLRVRRGSREATLRVVGGRGGSRVSRGEAEADATIVAPVETILGLMSGALSPRKAVRKRLARVTGNAAALEQFPLLFDAHRREALRAEGPERSNP